MRSILKLFTVMGIAVLILSGCYPNEDLYYSDTDVSVTRYDEDFTFADNMICVLFDTVMHVVDEDEVLEKGENDDHIIAEITRNLESNTNFEVYVVKDSNELIAEGINPADIDLAVTATVMETDYYNYYYYPWYGYWYWGWGYYKKSASLKSAENTNYYYYPWYPWGGGTYYTYTTGTIMIDMIDAKGVGASIKDSSADEEIKIPVAWQATINGILSGNTSDHATRITTELDQCFKQSPYLN